MTIRYPDNVIWKPQAGSQEAFLSSTPIFEVLYQGTRGGGKSIANHTKVLTTNGWKRADSITEEDLLIAGDGSPTSLLGIFPQEEKEMYKVIFKDGQEIEASGDHRWYVYSGRNQYWSVRTTEWLIGREGYAVPFMEKPAQTGTTWAGPDPYILGLIAGDGTIHISEDRITIYSVDEEILQYCAQAGWQLSRNEEWSTSRVSLRKKESQEWLRWIERRTKACPAILQADPASRLAYLQGLMDSDGTADKREGKPSFCNNEKDLAELGAELCWSLGGKATINIKKYSGNRDKHYYQVAIAHQNKFNPFRLSRKANLVITQKKQLKRYIEKVVPIGKSSSHRCFAVAHPSHTFVIEGYVVTHNTDSLLMSFGMFTGRGYGSAWKGILFRQTYKQLTDVITKTKKWFPQIWPNAKFNHSEHVWTWPGGEQLLLRQFKKADDYWNYHGHEYPWVGWEELCNWPSDDGYKRMFSCCRSSTPGMPRMIRATTNPYGPGHNWVKARFLPDQMNMKVRKNLVDAEGIPESPRLSIFSRLDENKILLQSDPDYINKIAASARNAAEKAAWLEGRWDIVSGGMFDDVWDKDYNLIKPFQIPELWKIDRSFDWGSSRPFSVGWWAVSNGEDVRLSGKEGNQWRSTVRGDLFRIAEWYGWTGKPNEGTRSLATDISRGIVERELKWGWRDPRNPSWCRVKTGVADAQIFSAENGNCIATDMANKVRLDDGVVYKGIKWFPADKRPGSRITGWDQMRRMLKNAHPSSLGPRERPGLFIFDNCENWVRTVPVLPRDEDDMDEVNTETEDHIADDTRYRVRFSGISSSSGATIGHY